MNNKVRYIGNFQAGKKHGQGEMNWPNGDLYSGEWGNDL